MGLGSKTLTPSFWKRSLYFFLLAMFTLTISRLVFYINCSHYFKAETLSILHALVYGLRFDMVSIAYLLGPFFLFSPFLNSVKGKRLAKIYFVGMLAAMNFLNCVDAEFFKFTARRSTDDLFAFAFMSNDIFNIAPVLLLDFWYLLLALTLITVVTSVRYSRILTSIEEPQTVAKISLVLLIGVLIIGARGGIQQTPLGIIDASDVLNQTLNAVVLNTPFTMIKTIGKPELRRFNHMDQAKNPHDPITELGRGEHFGILKKNNVVVLIVESLSKEYMGGLNGLNQGFTPFVDSLCTKSFVFTNGFANGHRSIEGIPAVVASIPTLMYEPYITSRYASNRINSLATTLNDEGYYSSFLHGGNNGSMGFVSFAAQAGFQEYYGRNEYPEQDHYDGHWGISDHYFLQQTVKEFDSYSKPFVGAIFTLSSHHPYTIPKSHVNQFPKGNLPIHESIGYADESLRLFFTEASKTDWYQNTLFVITADHTSLSYHPYYQTKTGSLSIPIIYFHPNDTLLTGSNNRITQQADIMPSILDLIGYEKPFFSL